MHEKGDPPLGIPGRKIGRDWQTESPAGVGLTQSENVVVEAVFARHERTMGQHRSRRHAAGKRLAVRIDDPARNVDSLSLLDAGVVNEIFRHRCFRRFAFGPLLRPRLNRIKRDPCRTTTSRDSAKQQRQGADDG